MALRLVAAVAVSESRGAFLRTEVERHGLTVLGGFAVLPEHGEPEGIASIALLGISWEGWRHFRRAPEAIDGAADPLDRWSRRVIGALAETVGAVPLFPFGGPPYQPFLRWAEATGRIWPSPVGMSIHESEGLWMSFRGALGFHEARHDLVRGDAQCPCEICADKPCLTACPVDAFATGVYDVPACVAHISTPEGADCLALGCRVRRVCPVGETPPRDKAEFHMRAFKRAREGAA